MMYVIIHRSIFRVALSRLASLEGTAQETRNPEVKQIFTALPLELIKHQRSMIRR